MTSEKRRIRGAVRGGGGIFFFFGGGYAFCDPYHKSPEGGGGLATAENWMDVGAGKSNGGRGGWGSGWVWKSDQLII